MTVPQGSLSVLVVCSGPWDNATAQYALEVAEGLEQHGNRVLFVCSEGSPISRKAVDRVSLATVPFGRPRSLFQVAWRFQRLIASFKPDIINVHQSVEHALAVVFGRRIPIVRTRATPRRPNAHPGNRLLYRTANATIACADFIYDNHLPLLGVPEERRVLIRPGFDFEKFVRNAPSRTSAREALGLPLDRPIIGMIARYTWAKAHTVLLEAFKVLLQERSEPTHLLCAGIEYDVRIESLRKEAERLGIDSAITFLSGKLPDVRQALQAIDVLAVPSIASEGIARIALEGLALGIPTVGTSVNSVPEIIGSAGILCLPNEPKDLAQALKRALVDSEFRQRARNDGPARILHRYAKAEMVERTEKLFHSVLRN